MADLVNPDGDRFVVCQIGPCHGINRDPSVEVQPVRKLRSGDKLSRRAVAEHRSLRRWRWHKMLIDRRENLHPRVSPKSRKRDGTVE
jgi:hypothetical protein